MRYLKFFESYSISELEKINKENIKRDFGEDSDYWLSTFSSKEKRHKGTYFHVNTKNKEPYSGVGNGFYLGKDPIALLNFYDIENNGYTISEFIIDGVKWLDLSLEEDFREFESNFESGIVNNDEVKEYVKDMGYDGIRYYDYSATGEEFVLFNMSLLNKISERNKDEILRDYD